MDTRHFSLACAVLCAGALVAIVSGCGPGDSCDVRRVCPTSGAGGDDASGGAGGGSSPGGMGGAGGHTAGGGGATLTPLGETCAGGSECDSGFCVDGVCCSGSCDGACQACDLVGVEGMCSPHPQGTDPEGECGLATCNGRAACGVGEELWAQRFGDANAQQINSMVVDSTNNIYVLGTFTGTISIGSVSLTSGGAEDVFAAKFAANGSLIWAQKFGGAGIQTGTAAAFQGHFFIGGSYTGTPSFGSHTLTAAGMGTGWYTARLNPSTGNVDWVHHEPSANADIGSVQAIAAGSSATFVATAHQSSFGDYRSIRRLGFSGTQTGSLNLGEFVLAKSLSMATNGDLLVGGWFSGSTSIAGGPTMVSAGSFDGFAARLTSNLTHVWSARFGGSGSENVNAIAERPDATVAVAGTLQGPFSFGSSQLSHQGGQDAMLLTLSSGGVPSTGVAIGSTGSDVFTSIAFDGSDDVVAGYTDGDVTIGTDVLLGLGGHDALVVKMTSASLTPQWGRRGGGPDYQRVLTMGIDTLGRITLAGIFRETLSFGSLLTSAGNTDAFLIQLSP